MRLHKVAKFFDRDPVYDFYTGALLFKGQFASYEGNQMDGTVQRRRTLSLAPGLVLPDRRVVRIYNETWVVGSPLTDGWESTPIRQTLICKLATDNGTIYKPGDWLQTVQPAQQIVAWNAEFLKNTVNTQTSSEYSPQFRVWVGINEPVEPGWLLVSQTPSGKDRLVIVRSLLEDPTGFTQVFADEATNDYGFKAWGMVDVTGGMDPITEQALPLGSVRMLIVDMYKMYNYRTAFDEKAAPGDLGAYAAHGAAPTGSTVTVGGYSFKVVRTTPMYALGADILHLRKL